MNYSLVTDFLYSIVDDNVKNSSTNSTIVGKLTDLSNCYALRLTSVTAENNCKYYIILTIFSDEPMISTGKVSILLKDKKELKFSSNRETKSKYSAIRISQHADIVSSHMIELSYEIPESDLQKITKGVNKIKVFFKKGYRETIYIKDEIGKIMFSEYNLLLNN